MTTGADRAGRSPLDTDGCGGDPPCWEGEIADQRDEASVPPVDLSTPAQVHDLVTIFYREIVFDDLLEPMFSEVAEVDWASHIPNLIDYWCRVLLGEPGYEGRILGPHQALHERRPLRPELFDRWLELFGQSVDGGWSGPYADRAKAHAAGIAATLARRLLDHHRHRLRRQWRHRRHRRRHDMVRRQCSAGRFLRPCRRHGPDHGGHQHR